MNKNELIEKAKKIRNNVIDMSFRAKSGHIGSSSSAVDILTYIYFNFMNVNPKNPFDENRDYFFLSKGHACTAFYSTLHEKGFIPKNILDGFGKDGGTLNKHPDKNVKFGIELSTGSLGQCLSVGAGLALGFKKNLKNNRVLVLLSDGECEEGSIWEAALFAAHHKLNNLIVLIDYNKIQALGNTNEIVNLEPFVEKWKAMNFEVFRVNGHDFEQIDSAFKKISKDKPTAIIFDTIKGKGIPFLENTLKSHYHVLNEEEHKMCKECLK